MSLLEALLNEGYRDSRDIYIALRSDGQKGSGTIDDPYDGSTIQAAQVTATSFSSTGTLGRQAVVVAPASLGLVDGDVVVISGVTGDGAGYWNGRFPIFDSSVSGNSVTFSYWVKRKGTVLAPEQVPLPNQGDTIVVVKLGFRFDDLMRQLGALPDTTAHIHLGPGVFETRGYSDATAGRPQAWQPRKRMKFRGSGMDITTLKLTDCDLQDGNYYAIGVAYGNLTDYAEVSDLTVDSNLPAQPVTRGFDYARVACSAVQLSGSFCRIQRVKAIHWGTQSTTEAFVLATAGSHPDFLPVVMENQVIEDCVCVRPNENNRYTSTVIHTGGGFDPFVGSHAYSKGAVLRRNFVDCLFSEGRSSFHHIVQQVSQDPDPSGRVWRVQTKTPHGKAAGSRGFISDVTNSTSVWNDYFEFEYHDATTLKVTFPAGVTPPTGDYLLVGVYFNGLSVGTTRACLVEENVVVNTSNGGPYQDTGHTREIIVRRNTYKNVGNGPYITNGNIYPAVRDLAITRVDGSTAEASSPGHGFAAGHTIQINKATNAAYNSSWTISSATLNTFRFGITNPPAGVDSSGYAVYQGANVSLLNYVSGGFAQGSMPVKHYLSVGDRIKITEATPSEYNGSFEITAVTDFTFQYKLPPSASGVNASDAALQRVWGIDKLVVEDNFIELRLLANGEYGTPVGIALGDGPPVIPVPPSLSSRRGDHPEQHNPNGRWADRSCLCRMGYFRSGRKERFGGGQLGGCAKCQLHPGMAQWQHQIFEQQDECGRFDSRRQWRHSNQEKRIASGYRRCRLAFNLRIQLMNTQRIISSALACLIFPALSPDHVFAAEIRDSFDAGNDNAWSRYEPLASAGGGGMFTFPDGGYRIQAGPSPDPGALGPMRLGSLRSDLSQGNTYAVFDLVDWNNSLNQSFGMLVRASTVGVGTTDGYAFGYSTAGMLSISLVTDEQYTVLASTPVTLDPAARYRFEVGVGEALGFGIYRENGSNPFEFLIVEDRTYLSGAMGFYLQANSPNSGVDATFDNFRALTIVPEPSAVSVFSIAALGGWWMVRRRLNTR